MRTCRCAQHESHAPYKSHRPDKPDQSSLKRALISSSNSSMAFSASGPSQRIRNFDPCPAASIIRIHNGNFFLNLLDGRRAVRSSIQQCHYVAPFCCIIPSSFALKSTAAFWPSPFNFSSIAATSIKRAMSRPGLTGIVTCGTLSARIS